MRLDRFVAGHEEVGSRAARRAADRRPAPCSSTAPPRPKSHRLAAGRWSAFPEPEPVRRRPGCPADLDIAAGLRATSTCWSSTSRPACSCTRCRATTARRWSTRSLARAGGGERGAPGIVHRLDRDTSGLLLVARDDAHAGPAAGAAAPATHRPHLLGARARPPALAARPHRGPDRPRPPRPDPHVARHRPAPRRGHRTSSWSRRCPGRSLLRVDPARRAARTRSACTWPRSATRWSATPSTATARSSGLERQFLHAAELRLRRIRAAAIRSRCIAAAARPARRCRRPRGLASGDAAARRPGADGTRLTTRRPCSLESRRFCP